MHSYTPAEKRERNKLLRKGFRQALADCVDPALEARLDKIDQKAAERGALELRALHKVQADARQALANAKAAERTAPRADRAAARQARRTAEDAVRRAERAVLRAED
ncbi:hypothetical protein ACFUJY_15150 [Streptomyces sp. NPDC057249]|uniref:hypothetical protein n=1 Tax=Streptomyces sp. NPDC057249 TaxID=3346067 RepID=UPI003643C1C8